MFAAIRPRKSGELADRLLCSGLMLSTIKIEVSLKKILKWTALTLIVSLLLLLVASYINHRLRLPGEQAAYPPPGQRVSVNDHRLHVYSEGSGQPTLVFLSGSGTSTTTLDFRALCRSLSTRYRVVVVERAGYAYPAVI